MRIKILDPSSFRKDASNTEIGPYEALIYSASFSRNYTFTNSWDDADVVLVASAGNMFGKHMLRFCRSEPYKRYRNKCYAISVTDVEYATLPGLYTSVKDEKFGVGYSAPMHYVTSNVARWGWDPLRWEDRDVPVSFIGSSATHPVRAELFKVHWPEGSVIEDVWTKGAKPWWSNDASFIRERQERYGAVMQRTQYALCPRGRSANSIRIYEAMEAGCVPLIVADEICLPSGPEWDRFTIRVSEDAVDFLSETLSNREDNETKGKLAREAWEQHFAPEKALDYLMVLLYGITQSNVDERNRIAKRNQIVAQVHAMLSRARQWTKGR